MNVNPHWTKSQRSVVKEFAPFEWYVSGGIRMVWRNSERIYEMKTLFQIKKEADRHTTGAFASKNI